MNRLVLKHGYFFTAIILAVFAWVVYKRISRGWSEIIPLAVAAGIVWVLGVPAFIFFWPRLTVNGYKRAILKHGLGGGPIPVNTLCAAPGTSSPSAPRGSLLATGTDHLLYIGGWLDLTKGPQVLHVPDTVAGPGGGGGGTGCGMRMRSPLRVMKPRVCPPAGGVPGSCRVRLWRGAEGGRGRTEGEGWGRCRDVMGAWFECRCGTSCLTRGCVRRYCRCRGRRMGLKSRFRLALPGRGFPAVRRGQRSQDHTYTAG